MTLGESTCPTRLCAGLLGYHSSEIPSPDRLLRWIGERVHPDDSNALESAFQELFNGHSRGCDVEVRLRHRGGHWLWIHAACEAIERNEDGSIRRLIGFLLDITARKQAEQALRESEGRFRLAVDYVPLVLAQSDRDLRYRWIYNPHRDFDADAVIGKRDDELEDSEGVRRLVALKGRVLETGQGAAEEIQFLRSDGVRTYDCRVEPLRDETGAVVGVTSAGLDVTGHKHEQEVLRRTERLLALAHGADEERRRLARDLHDDYVQRLALLEIRLETLARTPVPAGALAERIQPLRTELARLCDDLRRLSHQLHPAMLEHFGLPAALEMLCANYSAVHGTPMQCGIDLTRDLPNEIELALYRVVQEGLNNIARHARASQVAVQASVIDGELILHVEDDGIGFDQNLARTGGLGLLSMEERVSAVGGAMSILSQPGKGTLIQVTVQLGSRAKPTTAGS